MTGIIHHALVLNLHQPCGNLENLLEHNPWEAKEILWAMDRIPRSLWGYEDLARVHLAFSGTLLETLSNPEFQKKVYGITKCGEMLWHFQNTLLFEILGTGFYHPVMPLIPKEDWDEQLLRWLGSGRHIFWRPSFNGFWPPEMAFTMEMIPFLKRMGYRYVLVDSNNIEPVDTMRWEELRYKPHLARYEDDEIIVIARDRELSDAQESGMSLDWFNKELNERTKWCDFPPLVTTCTDGDNGGWFRNTSGQGNFWDYFYKAMLDSIRADKTNIRPTFISNYIDQYDVSGYVTVKTAAWNTGWHNGIGFTQWTGSQLQRDTLDRISKVSTLFHLTKDRAMQKGSGNIFPLLNDAHWHLLRSQTSCNFFWGEDWVYKSNSDLDYVENNLEQIYSKLE